MINNTPLHSSCPCKTTVRLNSANEQEEKSSKDRMFSLITRSSPSPKLPAWNQENRTEYKLNMALKTLS